MSAPFVERRAYDAANKDPLLALLLVLRAIWRGDLRADKHGIRVTT